MKSLIFSDIPWIEFSIGGVLFALIKYLSENVSDVRISSIVAAVPIGLISVLIIDKRSVKDYSYSYIINVVILFFASILFYLFIGLGWHIYLCLTVSLSLWVVLHIIRLKVE